MTGQSVDTRSESSETRAETSRRNHDRYRLDDRVGHLHRQRGYRPHGRLGGHLLLVWMITGAVTVIGALSYGELAGMMPHAGGQYVYLRESYNPLVGFSTAGPSLR